MKLRNVSLDGEVADLNRQIGQPDIADEKRNCMLRRQQEIRELRRKPLPPISG
jgi:hypothetical protein